jgi:nucleoside phosphorylase
VSETGGSALQACVPCDVLLAAAFHPELESLEAHLGDTMRARVGSRDVAARVVGIGLSMAAAGAARRIEELAPRALVLLGTCGAYAGAGLAIGDVVAARGVMLVDRAAIAGEAQFPEPMSVLQDADPKLRAMLVAQGAREADVATTLAVTTDDRAAARIAAATSTGVEHLEAHGVATACAARGVRFAAALGVANFVGASARAEWLAHHRAAGAAAVALVLRWLQAG